MTLVPTITRNQFEYSATITRTDGSKIDFVRMENEIIVGETKGDEHTQVVLNLEEAGSFLDYLLSALV